MVEGLSGKSWIIYFPRWCRYLSLALKEQDMKDSLWRLILKIS